MRYVRLGNSGAEVSQLCLGCMGFGEPSRGTHPWSLPEPDARAVTRAALEAGINFFDTANTYSDGSSEEILGRALRDFADRDEVVIASKVGLPMSGAPNRGGLSRKAILGSLEGTLRRLGTGHLDLYQLHRWDPDTPIDETLTTLADCVRAGTVRYLGASSTWAWQFAKLIYRGRAIAAPPFVSFQSHYNVLFREDEREVIPLCVDESVGVLAWSPLARGRLARPWGDADERTGRDPFRDELLQRRRRAARRHGPAGCRGARHIDGYRGSRLAARSPGCHRAARRSLGRLAYRGRRCRVGRRAARRRPG